MDSSRRCLLFRSPSLSICSTQNEIITVTIDGSELHLISYYTSDDIRSGRLPNGRPDIMALEMPLDIFGLTSLRYPPKVEIGPDGKPHLV
jgi:hypothetical protein